MNKKPDLIAYSVSRKNDEQTQWSRLGAAWSNKLEGYNLDLNSWALDNTFVLVPPREQDSEPIDIASLKKQDTAPSMFLYCVINSNNDKSDYWHFIGPAWTNRAGGYTIKPNTLPLKGSLVLCPRKEKDDVTDTD